MTSLLASVTGVLRKSQEKSVPLSSDRSAQRYRRAAWTSVAMGADRGLALAVGLLTVPMTIKYLGAERFGLWMTISSAVALMQFADLGIGNGLLNKIAEAYGNNDWKRMKVLLGSGIGSLFMISMVVLVGFATLSTVLYWPAVFSAKSQIAIHETNSTLAVVVLASSLNIALSWIIRTNLGLQEGYRNGVWQSLGNIAGLVALFLAIRMRAGLPVLVACIVFAKPLATVANGYHLVLKKHPWLANSMRYFRFSIGRELVVLGFWFLLFQALTSANNAIPNLVISKLLGLRNVAAFSVAARLSSAGVAVQSIILIPLWPAYTEAAERGHWRWIRSTLVRSMTLSGGAGLLFSAVMVVGGRWIISIWAGADSVPPQGVIWGLAIWIMTSSFYGPLTMLLNGLGKIRIQALVGLAVSVFFLALCVLLTKGFGVSGTAWAYGTGYTIPSIAVTGFIAYRTLSERQEVLV